MQCCSAATARACSSASTRSISNAHPHHACPSVSPFCSKQTSCRHRATAQGLSMAVLCNLRLTIFQPGDKTQVADPNSISRVTAEDAALSADFDVEMTLDFETTQELAEESNGAVDQPQYWSYLTRHRHSGFVCVWPPAAYEEASCEGPVYSGHATSKGLLACRGT